MFEHGIVAGKFYPFHLGHANLIQTALDRCRRVTVFVVDSGEDSGDVLRSSWVQEAFPRANVRTVVNLLLDDSTSESNVKWATYTNQLLGSDRVDAVFSSESYASGWARALGVEHVMVDQSRLLYHVSGTKIRKDPYYYFHFIHPVARPYFVKRVLLVGPESTGKTTLCTKLALDYQTRATPEFGRVYVERHGITDDTMESIFPHILNEQPRLEESLVRDANRVLFCDTDLYTTYVWHKRWQPNNEMRALIYKKAFSRAPLYDLVLIMNPEGTEWVDDGYRDQQNTRDFFFEHFTVWQGYKNPVILSGTWAEREARAKEAINKLLQPTMAQLPT